MINKYSSYSSIEFSNAYLQAFITLDPQFDQYQRTVYCFLDMFGFIGGIFGLFKTFGYVFVSYFIKRSFYSSIISKLYHIETQRNSKTTTIQDKKTSGFANNDQNKMIESPRRNKIAPIHLQTKSLLDSSRNNNIKEESKYEKNYVYAENINT